MFFLIFEVFICDVQFTSTSCFSGPAKNFNRINSIILLISSENFKNLAYIVIKTKVREGGKKYILHEMNVGEQEFERKVRNVGKQERRPMYV